MNFNYMFSLIAVLVLCLLAFLGSDVKGFQFFFGVLIPYAAIFIFILGFISRILNWSRSPVPFKIPTTCGQQKSFSWLKQSRIDNPSTTMGVIIRMALEILCFRSLFRNTRMSFRKTPTGEKISYSWEIWLWIFALAFHYSFLVVLIRHLRFFLDPVPYLIKVIENLDGFFRVEFFSDIIAVGLPGIYITGLLLLAAVIFLLLRRIIGPKVNYISLSADYFPLFLIIGIAVTGILMRYFVKVDIVGIKEFTMGLVNFQFKSPGDVGSVFYIHLFLVSVLFAYFPFSKLMHLGGVFLSPTRNMTTNTREKRHVNPWNYPVKVHTYDEYEDEFRDKMIEAGLPVDKKE